MGEALVRRREAASNTLAPDALVTLLTIRFDGSVEPRAPVRLEDVKGRLFRVHPGDVVFSKIDVRNGAIGLAPDCTERICVTSEFPVYAVDESRADPVFVKLLFRTDAFMRVLNSMISGASGRKRIQPSQLEKVRVPIPPPAEGCSGRLTRDRGQRARGCDHQSGIPGWRVTGGFLSEFMALVLRTDYFLALVAINRVGAVKQRMYYSPR